MATNITDTTVLTQPVNVIYQRGFLEKARAHCPYFLGTKAAEIMSHNGSFTAYWRRMANLTPQTSALTELNTTLSFPTRSGSQASTTNVQATLSKYGDFLALNEDVDLINFTGQTMELLDVLGIQAGRSLNMLQRNEMEDNSTAVLANAAASATAVNAVIQKRDIRKVVNTLDRNDAMKFTPRTTGSQNFNTTPVGAAYWGITHPDTKYDIENMAGFKAVETYAGQTEVADGEFGMVDDVRFISTSDSTIDAEAGATTGASGLGLRTTGNDAVDLYNTVIYGQQAFGSLGLDTKHLQTEYKAGDQLPAVQIIQKSKGSAGAADPLDEISTLGWKSWHAAKVLNSNWSRCIRSGATDI